MNFGRSYLITTVMRRETRRHLIIHHHFSELKSNIQVQIFDFLLKKKDFFFSRFGMIKIQEKKIGGPRVLITFFQHLQKIIWYHLKEGLE